MNYYLKLIAFVLFSFFSHDALAGYCYTLGNGDFEDTSNWSCGRVPGSGDTMEISAGDTIKVNNSITGLQGCWLKVYGTMDFKNAARVVFEYGDTAIPPSLITFFDSSSCINGNGSSGLSFGSGGSGCDVYRPASGANPGVYPTIPGSYYDGCVWASYLPIIDLWTNVSIINEMILFEWELTETKDIVAYQVLAGEGEKEYPISAFDARSDEQVEYYSYTTPIDRYDVYVVSAIHSDHSIEPLISVTLDEIIAVNKDYAVGPIPFDNNLRVSDREEFTVSIYGIDGRLVYEASNDRYYNIDTRSLESGLYFVMATRDGQLIDQRKLVKR